MNLKKWNDEKLETAQNEIDTWKLKHAKSVWSGKMGILVGLIGAFAISTGVVFMFFDGLDVMNLVLIILGSIVCFTWYKTDKQLKTNTEFLEDVKTEIARRAKKREQTSDQ